MKVWETGPALLRVSVAIDRASKPSHSPLGVAAALAAVAAASAKSWSVRLTSASLRANGDANEPHQSDALRVESSGPGRRITQTSPRDQTLMAGRLRLRDTVSSRQNTPGASTKP